MSTQQAGSDLFSPLCKEAYSARLLEIMAQKQAMVFSTTYCHYCTKAKKLLDKHSIGYTELMLDELNGSDQQEVANCIYG